MHPYTYTQEHSYTWKMLQKQNYSMSWDTFQSILILSPDTKQTTGNSSIKHFNSSEKHWSKVILFSLSQFHAKKILIYILHILYILLIYVSIPKNFNKSLSHLNQFLISLLIYFLNILTSPRHESFWLKKESQENSSMNKFPGTFSKKCSCYLFSSCYLLKPWFPTVSPWEL